MTENDKNRDDAITEPSLPMCILKKSGHTAWNLLYLAVKAAVALIILAILLEMMVALAFSLPAAMQTILLWITPIISTIIGGINGLVSWVLASAISVITAIPLWEYVPILVVVGIILHSAWWCLTREMVLTDEDWESMPALTFGVFAIILSILWMIFFAAVGLIHHPNTMEIPTLIIAFIPVMFLILGIDETSTRLYPEYFGAVINWYNRTHGKE